MKELKPIDWGDLPEKLRASIKPQMDSLQKALESPIPTYFVKNAKKEKALSKKKKKKVKWDYGWQEALHSAWIVMDSFDYFVTNHSKIHKNKEYEDVINKAQQALFDVYQKIGCSRK